MIQSFITGKHKTWVIMIRTQQHNNRWHNCFLSVEKRGRLFVIEVDGGDTIGSLWHCVQWAVTATWRASRMGSTKWKLEAIVVLHLLRVWLDRLAQKLSALWNQVAGAARRSLRLAGAIISWLTSCWDLRRQLLSVDYERECAMTGINVNNI